MADIDELRKRCTEAGYHVETIVDPIDPAEARVIFWYGDEDAETGHVVVPSSNFAQVLSSKFDDYRPLADFEAIWSHLESTVECGLSGGNINIGPAFRLEAAARRLGITLDPEEWPPANLVIDIPLSTERYQASLRFASSEFAILRGLFRRQAVVRLDRIPRMPVLRIEGVTAASEVEAADLLERVGNSVLFQVDLKTDIPLFLSRRQDFPAARRRAAESVPAKLVPPAFEYDSEPMALYWYARTAFQIPLLGFLGFYQVLEFYFPSFSTERAQAAVRNVLKDPRFDPNNDAHISRLLACVRPNMSGRGYGDERAQLQATIQACVTPQQMRDFLTSDDRLLKFYSKHGKHKPPIVDVRIPVESDADLRPQVATRIYEIRNRIVHTKSGDDVGDVLLPFSREARLLWYDLQLVEFVARQALITTSQQLHL